MENALSREISDAEREESEIDRAEQELNSGLENDCLNPASGECFTAGTEVETANGGEEPIQDVKQGDQVESRDQFNPNAPAQAETVTAVFQHTVTDLRDVTITGVGGSTETIRATDGHPFYVQNIGWVDAQALTTGEKVEEPDGSWATVSGNVDEPHPEGITVYNFEVDVNHTYFVSQGGVWVWVHNAPCGVNLNSNTAKSRFGIYEIKVKGVLYKIGKADLERVTLSSGLPTRLHQQLRKLQELFGAANVTGRVVQRLGTTTTATAKLSELAALQRYFNKTGLIPIGNIKSFFPLP